MNRHDGGAAGIALRGAANRRLIRGIQERIEGDDIDHAAGGVEAEQRGIGSLDDLDLANLFHLHGKRLPRGVTVIVQVNLAAVDEDEKTGTIRLVVAANRHIGLSERVATHIDAGYELQYVG